MTAEAEALLVELGLPPYQARVLLALLAAPGPATSEDLAGSGRVPRTSIYRAVDALIRQGLAATEPAVHGQPRAVRWRASSWDDVASTLRVNARGRYVDELARIRRFEDLSPAGAR